jgi:hypothetical protein
MANKKIVSIFDLNCNNVWSLDGPEVSQLWHKGTADPDSRGNEQKLKNVLRLAFDLETLPNGDERDKTRFQSMGYEIFSEGSKSTTSIAIRKKQIRRITDLSYENVKHISAPMLMELLNNNFGGGWDSISLSVRDIIESAFDISTTILPTDRLHTPGGTLDRKVADGYEVLEIAKGTWTEAIFAKKKDPVEKVRFMPEATEEEGRDEDDDDLANDRDDDEDEDDDSTSDGHDDEEDEDSVDSEEPDDTYYNSYITEAEPAEDPEEIGEE